LSGQEDLMRMLLALAVLMIVVVTMMKLMKSQLPNASITGAPAASSPDGKQPPLGEVPKAVGTQVEQLMQSGAAARASEPSQ
jgi:hypothetical protein